MAEVRHSPTVNRMRVNVCSRPTGLICIPKKKRKHWTRVRVASPGKFARLVTAERKRPHSETRVRSNCVDCSWISPTTAIVESLFSHCSRVMTAEHRSVVPCLFEAVVFLRENKDWWDLELVQEMVAGLWKDRLAEQEEAEAQEDDDEEDFEW